MRRDTDLNAIDHARFVGCGGAGMAPLAKILHDEGISVSGSDLKESDNTRKLRNLGIPVQIGHDPACLRELRGRGLMIHTSAVATDNPELAYAEKVGWTIRRRGEALADFAATRRRVVAVSGSHGKTTVTAMIAFILQQAGMNPGFLVGGKINGWEWSGAAGAGDLFVCEVDESDGTHALIRATIGLVANIDDDHAWSVGGRERLMANFSAFGENCETLIYIRDEVADALFSDHSDSIVLDEASLESLGPSEWGDYQRLNAALAVRVAALAGLPTHVGARLIDAFPGVARRMTFHHLDDHFALVEDYAHHPTEVRAAIQALRKRFPSHDLTVVFQPHRRARLERYFDDFARELRGADRVVVVPIFAAWVEDDGRGAEDLATAIGDKAVCLDGTWESVAAGLAIPPTTSGVLAIFGAGDVEALIPECLKRLEDK